MTKSLKKKTGSGTRWQIDSDLPIAASLQQWASRSAYLREHCRSGGITETRKGNPRPPSSESSHRCLMLTVAYEGSCALLVLCF